MRGLMILVLGGALQAQVVRMTSPRPRPNSLLGFTSISLGVSPSGVTFALAPGMATTAGSPISITTTLNNPLVTTVGVYGSFASATAALTGMQSGVSIPSGSVFGMVPTGVPTTWTAFTQTNPVGGSGSSLKLVYVSGLTLGFTRTDSLSLRIDLSAQPQLPADSYVGTLVIQAQAF